jgi:hypothetical protein
VNNCRCSPLTASINLDTFFCYTCRKNLDAYSTGVYEYARHAIETRNAKVISRIERNGLQQLIDDIYEDIEQEELEASSYRTGRNSDEDYS